MYGVPALSRFAWPIALALAGVVLPLFAEAQYYFFLANIILMNIVLAMGLDLLMGWAGQFAFAHVAFFGVGTYGTAILQTRLGIPFLIGMPIATALAGLLGFLIALPSIRLRSINLALATFSLAEAWQWVMNTWDSLTGGPNGMQIAPATIFGYSVQSDSAAFPFTAIIAALALAATMLLTTSRLGRAMCAVRENEHMAAACGVDVRQTKVWAFVISAVYAGVAGGMFTVFQSFVSPERFGFSTLVLLLSMIVVGGLGTIPGVVIGVVALSLLPEAMRSSLRGVAIWQEVVYGLILILCMVFMPRGIWGNVQRMVAARRAR